MIRSLSALSTRINNKEGSAIHYHLLLMSWLPMRLPPQGLRLPSYESFRT